MQRRKVCSCCGGQYPSSWFYDYLHTENKNEKPVFFRGKWHVPQYAICKICKMASFKADQNTRDILRDVRKSGEARNDRDSERHQQAA